VKKPEEKVKGGGKGHAMYDALRRIQDALDNNSPPLPFDVALVTRVEPGWHVVTRGDALAVRLDPRPGATAAQQTTADALVMGLDLTAGGLASAEVLALREQGKAILDALDGLGKILRAEADVICSEFNTLRAVVIGVATAVWDPASMANATGLTSPAVAVPGAAFGDCVDVCAPYDLAGVTAAAYVSGADAVKVRLHNGTGAAVNLASGAWKVVVRRHAALPPRDLGQLRTAIRNRLDSGAVDSPPP
jgi:hypothetical protein